MSVRRFKAGSWLKSSLWEDLGDVIDFMHLNFWGGMGGSTSFYGDTLAISHTSNHHPRKISDVP